MSELVPLFPLGQTVLFPGTLLPLHIFEDRYRKLVRALVDQADGSPRRFGVVAIRQGWEVGTDAVRALHAVGCAADLQRVSRYPDGRFDIVSVGSQRFRLLSVEPDRRPYLLGEVEWLPADPPEPGEADVLARSVGGLFEAYVAAAAALRGGQVVEHSLPADPSMLSYVVASAAVLTLEDRQSLLEATSATDRLRAELRLLKRETTMLHRLRALPTPLTELRVPQSMN